MTQTHYNINLISTQFLLNHYFNKLFFPPQISNMNSSPIHYHPNKLFSHYHSDTLLSFITLANPPKYPAPTISIITLIPYSYLNLDDILILTLY